MSVQFVVLSLHQAWNDAPTFDEPVYMATGLAGLYDGELRLNNEAPFLTKTVNALPLRIAGVDVPLDGAWAEADTIDGDTWFLPYVLAEEFTSLHAERGDLQRVVLIGRLMAVVEGLAIGLVLYALGATLFSRGAGLLAAGAWLTTPWVIGFGHINSIDLAFTLAVVAAALALVRYLRAPSWRTLAVLALAAGALQLTRQTGFLYVGVICLAVVVRRRREGWDAARDVAVVVVATWALVWVATLAVAPTRVPVDRAAVDETLDDIGATEQGAVAELLSRAVDVVPWPAEYEVGFQTQLAGSQVETQGFLLGDMWWGARPSYWPLTMLVKLPITVIALMLVGPFAWSGVAPRPAPVGGARGGAAGPRRLRVRAAVQQADRPPLRDARHRPAARRGVAAGARAGPPAGRVRGPGRGGDRPARLPVELGAPFAGVDRTPVPTGVPGRVRVEPRLGPGRVPAGGVDGGAHRPHRLLRVGVGGRRRARVPPADRRPARGGHGLGRGRARRS